VKLLYAKSAWEAAHLSLPLFLEKAARDGFDAAELFLPARPEAPAEIRRLCAAAGLKLIAQVATEGRTPEEHWRSLEALYARAAEAEPLLVNCQTGRDHFAFDDSVRVFERAEALREAGGVPLLHETHRGRALFTAPRAAAFLAAVPGLRLTADFSHWFCVHESDLSDQPAAVAAALAASHHVHARVGFAEGPQVGDPRGEAFAPWLALHLGLWRRIVAARAREGRPFLTITPEFGPAPYMPLRPLENEPVADAWEVNVWMRDRLALEFGREI
jgi:sugar phosphate isomerase/epimerase